MELGEFNSLVGDYSNYCCLALARGFGRTCVRLQLGKQSRRDRRYNYKRQAAVPAAVDGARHVALLCQIVVCGVLDGYETLHDVFKKQTQRHGTLIVRTCMVEPQDGAGSGTLVPKPGDQRGGPGWTGFGIPDSDFRFSRENHPISRRSMNLVNRKKDTEFWRDSGHVHRCCRLLVQKKTHPPYRSWR